MVSENYDSVKAGSSVGTLYKPPRRIKRTGKDLEPVEALEEAMQVTPEDALIAAWGREVVKTSKATPRTILTREANKIIDSFVASGIDIERRVILKKLKSYMTKMQESGKNDNIVTKARFIKIMNEHPANQ